MKLYTCKIAPNAKKVRLYLKEKGITPNLEIIEVDLFSGEQNSPEFRAINPLGKVPVLQFDDGSVIKESLSIIDYFEEIYPKPSLTGDSPEERAKIKAIERFIDLEIMGMMGVMAHHMMPLFSSRFTQSSDVIKYGRARQAEALDYLDHYIADRSFVYGDRVSIADITLYVTFEKAHIVKAELDPKYKNILRCYVNFSQRIRALSS
ncbi:MAG: glutathione S-transferase family protein [Emcibacter sp.]|nr:glutathione S-transferase family protein [Emcibacter sp.]